MNYEAWIWAELLAFDNTRADQGVGAYLECLGFTPKGISLMASASDFVMLHESLPACERFDLDGRQLALLRSALEAPRPRGLGVVNGLKEAFGSFKVRCFHKPGFAMNWFSDAVFVLCPDGMNLTRRWIVVMAGLGGRDVIDDAARRVGALIASGRLSRLSQNS